MTDRAAADPAPLPCPICKAPVATPKPDEPRGTFPFCSERCKLIDLGRWLGGKYQIRVEEPDESDADTQ